MVECLTDNPNRTAPNMRVCFRKGQMSAVAWDFDHVGMIEGEPENGADVEMAAIEAARRTSKLAKKKAPPCSLPILPIWTP
jgi:transcriptional/translational regulatory protein YebC/TACO1